ncbi:MAG TPA: SMP-30/gluconolactonase/LRE family protein [Terriglobales bacterium]|nr:SMP-30/gluconolactonase/LRE family protein [Terriglobales bacterium]
MRPAVSIDKFEVFADGLDHPEGLAFDRDGDLWVGGEQGQIYRITPKGKILEVAQLGGFCLGLTFSATQELWVCNLKKSSLIRLDRKGRILSSIERVGGVRLRTPNFSVFDSEGNLYFSDSGEWQKNNGAVFVLRADGKTSRIADSLSFPNGMALSADERTLYVVQSTANNVLALEIASPGVVRSKRIYAKSLERVPDGAVLDARGNLYVTCYASDHIYKVTSQGKVSVFAWDPCGTMLSSPTNGAFGGENFEYLYFANLSRWHICRVRVGVRGLPLVNLR